MHHNTSMLCKASTILLLLPCCRSIDWHVLFLSHAVVARQPKLQQVGVHVHVLASKGCMLRCKAGDPIFAATPSEAPHLQHLLALPLPDLQLLLGSMHCALDQAFVPARRTQEELAAVEPSLQRCTALTTLSVIVYAGPGGAGWELFRTPKHCQ